MQILIKEREEIDGYIARERKMRDRET